MENGDLKGKQAVVTGASRGIGLAIARLLCRAGVTVALVARDAHRLERARTAIAKSGGKAIAKVADITQESDVQSAFAEIEDLFGRIDILVNNAGTFKSQPVAGHALALWNEVLEVNLTGAFLACRAVIEGMCARRWGRIVNISSISGRAGERFASAYSASKFGMIGLTQVLALEAAEHGVTVNAVCPGWVNTDMSQEQLTDPSWCNLSGIDVQQSTETARLSVPQMRFVEPEEVADLVAYLCSERAKSITGQAISICGGLSLH